MLLLFAVKQAKRTTTNESLFNHHTKHYLVEGVFIVGAALSLFLLFALITYLPNDPVWFSDASSIPIHNAMGRLGAWLSGGLLYLFGYIAYLIPVGGFYSCLILSRHHHYEAPNNFYLLVLRVLGLLLILVAACSLFSLYLSSPLNYLLYGSGGILGSSLSLILLKSLNNLGSGLLLATALLAGIALATGLSWFRVISKFANYSMSLGVWIWNKVLNWLKHYREQRKLVYKAKPLHSPSRAAPKIPLLVTDASAFVTAETAKTVIKPGQRVEQEKQHKLFESHEFGGLPPLYLLNKPPPRTENLGYSKAALTNLSRLIESKLAEFGIEVSVIAIYPGPVITRFELDLAAGTKASKLTTLSRDLARALSLISVRIVEVIPGKPYVGLEIPNERREVVYLSEILSSEAYENAKSPLSLALGKNIGGQPVVVDLGKMPHLLVAGTTGSGKSVGLNAMLLSLLYKSAPDTIRLIMVDPKMLELSIYDGIPHLLTPVITDMKEAANALRWCIGEMDRRYRLMSMLGVRNLAGYNTKISEGINNKKPVRDPSWPEENAGEAPDLEMLPNIVLLVDEFADMMMVVGKKVEELITRLAQKARAAGIHLILATQRPSVDVITGLIKANVPARIAFQTSSRIDSRTILDQQGAEQLLGHGDMLFMSAGTEPSRIHGAFVADQEVHAVVNFLKQHGQPNYLAEILAGDIDDNGLPVDMSNREGSVEELDVLFDQAAAIVAKTRRASISNVQRRLKIGYNRAARILEQMEARGMVSAMESNGAREVLLPEIQDEAS